MKCRWLKLAWSGMPIPDPAAPLSSAWGLSTSIAAHELRLDCSAFLSASLVQVAGLALAGLKLALLAAVGAAGAHGYCEGRQRLNKVGT